MRHALGAFDVMNSPKLLGPYFAGPSWALWRTVVKAMNAEPMTVDEIAAFRAVADRDPPEKPVTECVLVAGRGAGKDSVATLMATSTAVNFNPRGKLRPGERGCVALLAVDRSQASIAFNYIKGYFTEVPALARLVKHIGDESIELTNHVAIEVHTADYRRIRGRTIIAAIFDEVAFWRSEDSASPDFEVAAAVGPSMGRIPGHRSPLILISSAHRRSGLLYERWKTYYGKNDPNVLVVKGTTLQFNPQFDAKIIARDLAADPALYNAEYNSQWRDDLATFLPRDLLEAAVDSNVKVRPPIANTKYFCFADPSGGSHDSFALAIAHREPNGIVVLDLLYERHAPFNPSEVVAEIAALLKTYHCSSVTGDKYAAKWVIEAFAKVGINYRHSDRDRSAVYLDVLPLFTSGRARLIDNTRLVAQFAGLERRTFPTGRDRIDHGPGQASRDDACNAAAGALVLASAPDWDDVPIVMPLIFSNGPRNIPGQYSPRVY
jgi:hypothetical protein